MMSTPLQIQIQIQKQIIKNDLVDNMKIRRIRHFHRELALMLAAGLTLTGITTGMPCAAAPAYAAEMQEENTSDSKTIKISSLDDFLRFARFLNSDADSEGKSWVLTTDIDLAGTDFSMIPVFAGTFDGNGHTISGFFYDTQGSKVGLIRVLTEKGVVRDLRVESYVTPSGEMNEVGILTGVNYGKIENCTLSGNLLGLEAVGAAAGHNMESGRIIGTVNESTVTGMRRTGGIAGFNEGTILDCENKGEVNAGRKTAWEINDEREKAEEDAAIGEEDDDDESESKTDDKLSKLIPDSMDPKNDDLTELLQNDQKVNYTGGIAGASSGIVSGCLNTGKVGFDHTGYKTGGIVGYERGILDSCSNNGTVKGRKSIGGIAGQFEPYTVNAYHDDAINTARQETDKLVDHIASLQKTLEQEDINTQADIDAIRGTADDLRGTVSGYKNYYRAKDDQMEAEIREHTGAVRNIIDGLDPDLVGRDTKSAFKALQQDLNDMNVLMEAAEKAAGSGVTLDMTNYSSKMLNLSKDMLTQVDTLLGDAMSAGKSLKDTEKDLERLRDAGNSLDDTLRMVYDSYKSDFRATDASITERIDKIADEMDKLNEDLKGSDSRIREQTDEINSNLKSLNKAVNDSFDEMRTVLERYRNTDNLNDIFDDISDDSDDTPAKGRITKCNNTGAITADINGGGIVGMADTDIDLQSDFEVVSSGQVSLKYDRTKRATVIDCTNYGFVSVKNSNAGGIAGSMDIGAVISSYNFGGVQTEDGDYAGGIIGKSGYLIRDSFSMSSISGNNYIGGIAGYGCRVVGNRSMTDISVDDKEYLGTIAGDINDEKKVVSGNIYVENKLGAVNGLTYTDEAKAVSYTEFIELDNTPEDARKMHVSFVADGMILKMMEVPYGGAVMETDYPELPIVGDRFGVWEEKDLSDIRKNITVKAKYITIVTTVASEEPFPVMLVSGNFYRGTTLTYTEQTPAADMTVPEGYRKVLKQFTYQVHSDYGTIGDQWVVRLLADGIKGKVQAGIIENGHITPIDTERDGRYLVFPMKGDGTFCILEPKYNYVVIAAVGIAGILLLILLFILLGKKKNGGKKMVKEDRTEENKA